MGCSTVGPTNPISALIVGSLGENYFPPYDLNFQPVDRSKLTEEKFLKMNTPGGGKIKPIGDPKHVHISEYLTPISGVLGSVFALFAPLYIILDVIRALIDIICALFNPIPLILTVVDLFLNVVPPLIALYPPLSSILHAINAAKLITAIVGGVASALIPIIFNVVECALSIPAQISEGNIGVIDNIAVKICELLQDFTNALAGFGPIKFILDMLEVFLGLGAKFFCVGAPAGDSPCCTSENCPPIIINPPAGEATVLQSIKRFSLKDLADFIFDFLNIGLEPLTDFLAIVVGVINDFIGIITDTLDDTVSPIIDQVIGVINTILESLNGLVFGALTPVIDGLDLSSFTFSFSSIIPDVPALDLTLEAPDAWDDVVFIQPAMFIEYNSAVSQANENGLISQIGIGHNFSPAEMSELQNFIIPPEIISVPLPKLPKFLGGSDDEEEDKDPATIKVKLTRPGGAPVERQVVGETKIFTYNTIGTNFDPIVIPGTTTVASGAAGAIEFSLPNGDPNPLFETEIPYVQGTLPRNFGEYMVDYENGAVVVFVGTAETPFTTTQYALYEAGREVVMNYSYLATTEAVTSIASAIFEFPTLEQVLAGLGLPNTEAAADTIRNLFQLAGLGFLPLDSLGIIQVFDDTFDTGDEIEYEIMPVQIELLKNNLIGLGCQNDIQAAAQALTALITADTPDVLEPLGNQIGLQFPAPPEEALQELLDQLTEDPTTPVDPLPILNGYLEELAEFADAVLCTGASSVSSEFTVSKPFVLANSKDTATVRLTIKDQGGNDLLVGGLLPSSDFRAQFDTTLGELGPVEFDPDTGSFFATISSNTAGIANITAKFIVRGEVCASISEFTDLEVREQVLNVEFVPERTAHPRVRRQPQYVQSRGGRARR